MEELLHILYAVLEAVALAVIPMLAIYVVKFLLAKSEQAKAELKNLIGDTAYYRLQEIVKIAVLAAEQENAVGFIEDKKEYAVELAQAWLEKYGIDLDLSLIAAAVEAAVKEEFNEKRVYPEIEE